MLNAPHVVTHIWNSTGNCELYDSGVVIQSSPFFVRVSFYGSECVQSALMGKGPRIPSVHVRQHHVRSVLTEQGARVEVQNGLSLSSILGRGHESNQPLLIQPEEDTIIEIAEPCGNVTATKATGKFLL